MNYSATQQVNLQRNANMDWTHLKYHVKYGNGGVGGRGLRRCAIHHTVLPSVCRHAQTGRVGVQGHREERKDSVFKAK